MKRTSVACRKSRQKSNDVLMCEMTFKATKPGLQFEKMTRKVSMLNKEQLYAAFHLAEFWKKIYKGLRP